MRIRYTGHDLCLVKVFYENVKNIIRVVFTSLKYLQWETFVDVEEL